MSSKNGQGEVTRSMPSSPSPIISAFDFGMPDVHGT
jgi:hypothetical protein